MRLRTAFYSGPFVGATLLVYVVAQEPEFNPLHNRFIGFNKLRAEGFDGLK